MRHIPNILSVIRLGLIPFFIWQMLAGNTIAGGLILLVSGATDFLDGFLARRFGWVSDLGKILDPAADKLTQVAAYIVMIVLLRHYWYFFAIVMLKEVVMFIGGAYFVRKGVKLPGAHWFGKVSTAVFYAVVILIALFGPSMPEWMVFTLLCLTTAVSVAALLMYLPEFQIFRRQVANGQAQGRRAPRPAAEQAERHRQGQAR